MSVALLGGPHDRRKVDLSATPPVILVGRERYERIDDPDTGEFLGGYVHTAAAAESDAGCECPPCPGRGNDGHGLTHCAECCFGSGVEADIDCPTHGRTTTPPPNLSTSEGDADE